MGGVALVVALGVVGGVLAGLFGIGGGIIFVPTLAFVLGMTQLHAEATSLLAILPTTAVGAWRQRAYGNVRGRAALVVGLSSIVGVQAGVVLARSLTDSALRHLFGAFLLVIAAQIAWRSLRK